MAIIEIDETQYNNLIRQCRKYSELYFALEPLRNEFGCDIVRIVNKCLALRQHQFKHDKDRVEIIELVAENRKLKEQNETYIKIINRIIDNS